FPPSFSSFLLLLFSFLLFCGALSPSSPSSFSFLLLLYLSSSFSFAVLLLFHLLFPSSSFPSTNQMSNIIFK
uniref:Uncharacterized protein n=1 Tax=Chenopodium quinoa TaxID=63459 RepID=A0A803L0B9_CHEQI